MSHLTRTQSARGIRMLSALILVHFSDLATWVTLCHLLATGATSTSPTLASTTFFAEARLTRKIQRKVKSDAAAHLAASGVLEEQHHIHNGNGAPTGASSSSASGSSADVPAEVEIVSTTNLLKRKGPDNFSAEAEELREHQILQLQSQLQDIEEDVKTKAAIVEKLLLGDETSAAVETLQQELHRLEQHQQELLPQLVNLQDEQQAEALKKQKRKELEEIERAETIKLQQQFEFLHASGVFNEYQIVEAGGDGNCGLHSVQYACRQNPFCVAGVLYKYGADEGQQLLNDVQVLRTKMMERIRDPNFAHKELSQRDGGLRVGTWAKLRLEDFNSDKGGEWKDFVKKQVAKKRKSMTESTAEAASAEHQGERSQEQITAELENQMGGHEVTWDEFLEYMSQSGSQVTAEEIGPLAHVLQVNIRVLVRNRQTCSDEKLKQQSLHIFRDRGDLMTGLVPEVFERYGSGRGLQELRSLQKPILQLHGGVPTIVIINVGGHYTAALPVVKAEDMAAHVAPSVRR
ncbi:unnamed protein product [Amoebophrya sp. A120]|nr:unnamed protein product [Amoebophrya sp. A120]|eukprot:GSA120T00013818001.1